MKATPRYAGLLSNPGRMLHAVAKALCQDGKRRLAVVTSHGKRMEDPSPSVPSTVKVWVPASGRTPGTHFTVSGYLQKLTDGDWTFTARPGGDNAWVLTT